MRNLQSTDTSSSITLNARNININTDDDTLDSVNKTIIIKGQPTIDFGLSPVQNLPLANDSFWLGNALGVATPVAMSGDATMDNTGVITLTPNSIETPNITDYSITNNKIATGAVDDRTISGVTWVKVNKTGSNLSDLTTRSHLVLSDIGMNTHPQIDTHIANTSNPHMVTKAQILTISGLIQDSDIAPTAGIEYGKLSIANSITDSDIFSLANIQQSKISGLVASLASKEPLVTKGNLIGNGIINVTGGANSVIGAGASLSITKATNSQDGYLSASDWTAFNNKQASISAGSISTSTSNVHVSNGVSSTVGPNVSIDIDTASSISNGLLSATDWMRFNAGGVTPGNLTSSTSALHVTGGSGSVIGTGTGISIDVANNSQPGILSSSDWITFNGKQSALGFTPVPNTRQVNGHALSSDISLVTSDLSTDSTHRYVTDTQISNWNGKQDGLGYTPENIANKGAANGYVPLDGSAKISSTYLPSSVMNYVSRWDPNTNTPSLSDGTGTNGQVYWCSSSKAGTVSGLSDASMINFQVGDLIIYSSTLGKYELTTPAAGVQSVNGMQGAVSLTKGSLSESTSSILTITGGSNSVWGSGTTIQVTKSDSTHDGYLSSSDWSIFNGKQAALSPGNASTSTTGVTVSGTGVTVGPSLTIDIATASASTTGLLTSSDWTNFNTTRYVTALSWIGTGPYTMTLSAATHGRGLNPLVRAQEIVAGPIANDVWVDVSTAANGNVTLTSSISFTGQVIIV